MQIDNEFTVGVPIERAWAMLTDLPGIAPCMPGAQLTGVEGDVYSGRVKVKVGPVTSEYAGTATFTEKDDTAYHAVIDARGRDARGAGNASAAITAQLRADGDRTIVSVSTDLKISGRIAQFGSGMIKEVSAKLLRQFVECLEGKLAATAEGGQSGVAAAPAGAESPGASASASADAGAGVGAGTDAGAGVGPSVSAGAGAGASAGTGVAVADAPAGAAEQAGAVAGSAAPGQAPAPASTVAATAEAPVLDLMNIAGGSIYKRALPLAVAVVVVIGVLIYFLVR